jgi:hypothetical protein
MKKIFRFLFCGVLLVTFLGCPGGGISDRRILSVPHCQQIAFNYCAVACIQMWREYDNRVPNFSQQEIGAALDVKPYGLDPDVVANGVCVFTNSVAADLKILHDYEPGAQGDLVSACIEGVRNNVPSIMPFYWGTHSVLFIGYKGLSETPEGRPLAKFVYVNDPEVSFGSERISFGDLKDFYFSSVDMYYYVILADLYFFGWGTIGHDQFVWSRGTYYGGPSVYDPKGLLDLDPPTI